MKRLCSLGMDRPATPVVAVLLMVAIAFGCGRHGLRRYGVSGTVTFNGQPVPSGRIALEPDSSQGNSGPGAYASIQHGRYGTPRGKGHTGGPHVVRIHGFSSEPNPARPPGPRLFSEYTITLDLPQDTSVQDIQVPAEHGVSPAAVPSNEH